MGHIELNRGAWDRLREAGLAVWPIHELHGLRLNVEITRENQPEYSSSDEEAPSVAREVELAGSAPLIGRTDIAEEARRIVRAIQ
jgi:hypothetical protein